MSNRVLDVNVARAENDAFEAKCAHLKVSGQKLWARIRPSSKYFGQSESENELFPIVITLGRDYNVKGGPGGQYRLRDVDLFVAFDPNHDPIQITFDGGTVSTE